MNREIQELIEKAVKSDVAAFEEIISLFESDLMELAVNIAGGDRSVADDLFQNGVIEAFKKIDRLDLKRNFSAWLWQTVKASYFFHLKNYNNKQQPEELEENTVENFTLFTIDERRKNLNKLLKKLSKTDQEIITLIDFIGLSLMEVAILLEISTYSAKIRIHKARDRLITMAVKHEELFI